MQRPMRSPIQPQKKAPGTAPRPAEIRMIADWPYVMCHTFRMNAGHTHQKEVEEIEHVAEIRGEDDPPLVGGQLLLPF